MKRIVILMAGCLFILISCKTVPITGRKQLNMVPDFMIRELSFSQYDSFIKNSLALSPDDSRAQVVMRVGNHIQQAVEKYMKENNLTKEIKNFKWEYNTIVDSVINAWCMPGGKVVVYTGLLPVAKTEEGLAVVMGHEIAHAIARHGNERMSESLLINLGGLVLQEALKEKEQQTQLLFLALYSVGSNLALALPHSRLQESEADKLGLIFAAMAGYNPEAAIPFWQRMATLNKNKIPEFLSTHPSNEKRLKNLSEIIPEIKAKYYSPEDAH